MPKVEIHLEISVPSDNLDVNQIVALFQEVQAQVGPALVTCYLESTQDLVLDQVLGQVDGHTSKRGTLGLSSMSLAGGL